MKEHYEPKRPIPYASPPIELYHKGLMIENKPAKALYFFLYLTGARINEATAFSPSHITLYDNYITIRLKTLKARSDFRRNRHIPIPLGIHAKCNEIAMWDIVANYLQRFDVNDKPFMLWKNMSEYLAEKITIRIEASVRNDKGRWNDEIITKRFNPHYLRHCRLTHLVDVYQLGITQVADFAGHANINMSARYVRSRELIKAFIK